MYKLFFGASLIFGAALGLRLNDLQTGNDVCSFDGSAQSTVLAQTSPVSYDYEPTCLAQTQMFGE